MGLFSFSSSKRKRHGHYGGAYYGTGGYWGSSSSKRRHYGHGYGYGAPRPSSGLGGLAGLAGAAGLGGLAGVMGHKAATQQGQQQVPQQPVYQQPATPQQPGVPQPVQPVAQPVQPGVPQAAIPQPVQQVPAAPQAVGSGVEIRLKLLHLITSKRLGTARIIRFRHVKNLSEQRFIGLFVNVQFKRHRLIHGVVTNTFDEEETLAGRGLKSKFVTFAKCRQVDAFDIDGAFRLALFVEDFACGFGRLVESFLVGPLVNHLSNSVVGLAVNRLLNRGMTFGFFFADNFHAGDDF